MVHCFTVSPFQKAIFPSFSGMAAQYSNVLGQDEEPENTERMSPKADSIDSTSTVDIQTNCGAIGKTLTARASHMSMSERVTTIATNATADPDYEVDWDGEDDPENPKNWNFKYKSMGILFLSWNTLIV